MTTSLGLEDELQPVPGPRVPTEPSGAPPPGEVYACLSLLPERMAPSSELHAKYISWLEGGAGVKTGGYVGSGQLVVDEWGGIDWDEEAEEVGVDEPPDAAELTASGEGGLG